MIFGYIEDGLAVCFDDETGAEAGRFNAEPLPRGCFAGSLPFGLVAQHLSLRRKSCPCFRLTSPLSADSALARADFEDVPRTSRGELLPRSS
jgi:hypothetical protein